MCPKFEQAVALLSHRWNGLIIYQLLECDKRFSELQQSIGISNKVLSERLKYLEQQKIIIKEVISVSPMNVIYQLTPKGQALAPVIDQIEMWSKEWLK
ncbi:winged helix-turn-helix transcriptional regulator [Macrococcus equi]|uniref:winged helix-turn-helix transcriptional regulator n=1 Tax=Macrococcus equi TaxID=3395462 RepID=UPI0039BE9759